MANYKIQRLAADISQEISNIIANEANDSLLKTITIPDKNDDNYGSDIKDGYYDSSFIINPAFFGLKNSDLTSEYYTIEATGAHDYVKPIANGIDIENSTITVKVQQALPDLPSNPNSSVDFVVIRNRDLDGEHKREDLLDGTTVGYKFKSIYNNEAKYAKTIHYKIHDKDGNVLKTIDYTVPVTGTIDYSELNIGDGLENGITDGNLHRGQQFYITYTIDLDTNYDGTVDIVYPLSGTLRSKTISPERQRPTFEFYPSVADNSSYTWKYTYKDVDHTLLNKQVKSYLNGNILGNKELTITNEYKTVKFNINSAGVFAVYGDYNFVDGEEVVSTLLTSQYYEGVSTVDFGKIAIYPEKNRVIFSFLDFESKRDLFNRISAVKIDFVSGNKKVTLDGLSAKTGNITINYSLIESLIGKTITPTVTIYYDSGIYGYDNTADAFAIQQIRKDQNDGLYYCKHESSSSTSLSGLTIKKCFRIMSVKYNFVQKANPNNRDAVKKWYAVPSSESAMSGKAMTRAATANTSTSAIEMEAAMEYLANYIPQQLLQGHTVKVPGLGTFRIAFKSAGVNNLSDFNVSAMIKEPRILFTPDKALRTSVINNLAFENGGVLNIYNTLNLVKDTTVDYDRYGLLEISGEVVVGAYGVLDLSEVTLIGNGGISINHGGAFVLDETPAEAGEYHKGVIMGLTPGVVSMSGYNSEQVDIDKSYIIGDFYGGSNSGELAAALTDAANAGETYYGVQVKLWDTTITLDRDVTVPKGVTLILNNNGDGYYEELLIPDGRKLINNGTIILNEETCLRVLEGAELENNGEIIINQWAAMYKYGTLSGEGSISGDGDYAEGIMTHADLMAELEKINNDDSEVGSWIHESITTLDPAVNGGVLDISMGIRASDNLVRRFRFTDYGKIIVPNGCSLIISSPTILMGGQILVEAGGKLVINNTLNVGLGTVYVANGGEVNWNADVTGRITFQDDIPENHLSTYWVHNYGEGWFENYAEYWPNYDFRMVPGEEHFWIFYTNVWDAENLKWIRTPVPVNNLRGSNNLTVFPMSDLDWDEADKAARAGEANADCFAVVRINDDARWGSTGKVTAEGLTYNITIDRDYNGGFYSAPEATNENWLINYQYNKFRNEDSFYFIFTNEDVTVKEVKAEDESLASVVPYDDSGRIFKVTLNKDALQLDEQINNYHGFDVNLNVVVTNPSNGEENWDFGIYCEPLVWNTPEGDLSHADLMAALDAQKNVNNWAAGWIQDAVTVLDPGTNGGVLDISMGTRESDGLTRYFAVVDGGEIIVPSGCELIITNPTRLQGGKITVKNGGTLTVNGTLNVGTGTVYMESGATINWGDNNMLLGEITFENSSKDSYLSAFWLRDWGEGWFESCKYEESIRDFRFTPGQEFQLIFYSNVWNETEAKWERTPIKPSSLSYDETLLEILEWNYEDFPVQEGEANSDCFVLVRPNGDVWDKDIQIQYNGMSFNVHIGRDLNMGFYSAPEATNENWLTNYAFNGYRAEDSFYYIFTKEVEGVTYTVNDVTLWDDCKQYADIAKYSDNIYKITLKDEYRNNYDMSFGINVDAHLTITSGSSSSNTNWGFGEIRCLPLPWNGNVGNPTPHEDLLVILEHLHDWSSGWVQETTTTLKKDFNNGKLDTAVMGIRESDNRARELFLFEGGEIIKSAPVAEKKAAPSAKAAPAAQKSADVTDIDEIFKIFGR